jgi:hypothetical protein
LATLAPVVFLAHDVEEALQTERMSRLADDAGRRLPGPLGPRGRKIGYRRGVMIAADAAFFVVQVGVTQWSCRSRRGRRVLQALLAGRSFNAITHLAETLALRRYVPGTATSPANLLVACLLLAALRTPATHTAHGHGVQESYHQAHERAT